MGPVEQFINNTQPSLHLSAKEARLIDQHPMMGDKRIHAMWLSTKHPSYKRWGVETTSGMCLVIGLDIPDERVNINIVTDKSQIPPMMQSQKQKMFAWNVKISLVDGRVPIRFLVAAPDMQTAMHKAADAIVARVDGLPRPPVQPHYVEVSKQAELEQ